MSLAESFFNTAKDLLTMTEDIKRIGVRIDKLAEDHRSLDRGLIKIELMVDIAKESQPRRRAPKQLP
jgi:hypothetical protein